ncbi:MAG: hypothetical protein OCD01_09130 [Fibrobacterales bacterium]
MRNTNIVLGLLTVGIIVLMNFDVLECASKYLYFTTELILMIIALFVYLNTFHSVGWNAPYEKDQVAPRPHARSTAKKITVGYLILVGSMAILWALLQFLIPESKGEWLHSGLWYGTFVGITLLSFLIIRSHRQYVNMRAVVVTLCIVVPMLTGYEAIMLYWGKAWEYNQTTFGGYGNGILGTIFKVPVESVLFLYPVTPVTGLILYSVITRKKNDLKAFWIAMAILTPSTIITEVAGIYLLDLWRVFNENSVLPMGRSNFEEYVYYEIWLGLALLIYIWFDRNLISSKVKEGV